MTTNLARSLIVAYTGNERWKSDHIEAQLCFDVEESMAWGVRLFEGLKEFDARLESRALAKFDETVPRELDELASLYLMWLQGSEVGLSLAKDFASKGYSLAEFDAFEKAVLEARWICESAAIESQMQPYRESLDRLRPENPNPSRYGD